VERFDTIVVGAGPAGSTTAYRLAQGGARTLLVDKARFPRDKPCGGGLTLRAVRQLPEGLGVEPVVEHVVNRMELRLGYGRSFRRGGSRPLVLMTQRRRLDHHLAQRAVAAGADFRDGVRVTNLVVDAGRVTVEVDGEPVEAAALVGADGANGLTARTLGLGGGTVHGVAFEGNVRHGPVAEERFRGLAAVELGVVPGGYAWVFPKGDHVNVGVGGWESEGPKLRAHLGELCRQQDIDPDEVENLRGHRLPLRGAGAPAAKGRALLVGDAAGLVDPLSGDGMYEAFVSSRLAAESVHDLLGGRAESLEPYSQQLANALGGLHSASWGAKIALDRFPRLTFALGRAPPAWGVVERLLCGDIGYPGAERSRLARLPLKGIEALAKAAGDPGAAYRAETLAV
jgi:geranylgeranyl reductase family protein